jgi:hypothetical protein
VALVTADDALDEVLAAREAGRRRVELARRVERARLRADYGTPTHGESDRGGGEEEEDGQRVGGELQQEKRAASGHDVLLRLRR